MSENDEYSFYYKNRNFLIKTGKRTDDTGDTVYYARTIFKNILALAECKEKALENCVKKIKFTISLLEKKINLLSQDQAVTLAKMYFENNFTNKDLIRNHPDMLSCNIFAEDEILTVSITTSNHEPVDDGKIDVIAIVYVDLVTKECDMIENNINIKKFNSLDGKAT